jgi:hypothetical protein
MISWSDFKEKKILITDKYSNDADRKIYLHRMQKSELRMILCEFYSYIFIISYDWQKNNQNFF